MKTMLLPRRPRCRRSAWPGIGLAAVLLAGAGCAGFPQVGTGAHHPTPAQVQAAMQWQDHYLYFPGYEIYYNRTQGSYVYLTGQGWVEQFTPPTEVDLQALLASPHVETNFHDSPSAHHARMIREYPRNWGSP
jgi:hypothetical protein